MLKIISFGATWCPQCPRMKPVLFRLAEKYDVDVLDADESTAEVDFFEIKSLPTTLLVVDGVVRERIIGAKPYSYVLDKIKELHEEV